MFTESGVMMVNFLLCLFGKPHTPALQQRFGSALPGSEMRASQGLLPFLWRWSAQQSAKLRPDLQLT